MLILGLQKVTLIDYPSKVACVVFTHGCNFRCSFCHNPELVIHQPNLDHSMPQEEFFKFLDTRKNKLDGVVITGGEPLLHPDLESFISKIKSKGFLVKLDTNGSFSTELEKLLESGLIDYVAMDVKIGLEKYQELTTWKDLSEIEKSLNTIKTKAPDYEFRTTVVKGIHSEEDIMDIAELVEGAKRFVLQNFVYSDTISSELGKENEFTKKELEVFKRILKNYVKDVSIRNAY